MFAGYFDTVAEVVRCLQRLSFSGSFCRHFALVMER